MKLCKEYLLKNGILLLRALSHRLGGFQDKESGFGTIELVLILVVLIALVIIFRDRVRSLLITIMDQIQGSAGSVWE